MSMNRKKFHFALVLGFLAFAAQAATPAVKAPAPASKKLQAACMAADFNHDGFVSLDEFHQDVLSSWRALHPDASGYVIVTDLEAIPGMGRGMIERLKRADTDGDGKLSFKEVVMVRMAYFEAADTNNDDMLSMQECVDHQRKMFGASGKTRK
jgi:Ca2+-binding EF-hand superfamily protein